MSDREPLLDELCEAWRYTRRGFAEEAANIPTSEWDFRPTPEVRSVAELTRHVIESSLMGVGEVSRADGDFTRQNFVEHIREHASSLPEDASREEWLTLLEDTLEEGIETLRSAGEDLLLQPIRAFNGESQTRLTWFHHSIAHEDYHRGQLTLYARLTGQVPALTQRIQGS